MKNTKFIMLALALGLVAFGLVTQNYWGIMFGAVCFAVAAVQMLG